MPCPCCTLFENNFLYVKNTFNSRRISIIFSLSYLWQRSKWGKVIGTCTLDGMKREAAPPHWRPIHSMDKTLPLKRCWFFFRTTTTIPVHVPCSWIGFISSCMPRLVFDLCLCMIWKQDRLRKFTTIVWNVHLHTDYVTLRLINLLLRLWSCLVFKQYGSCLWLCNCKQHWP